MGFLGTGEKVFVKLWDSWKCSADEMKREAEVYSTLRSVWGKILPRMIVHGGWVQGRHIHATNATFIVHCITNKRPRLGIEAP